MAGGGAQEQPARPDCHSSTAWETSSAHRCTLMLSSSTETEQHGTVLPMKYWRSMAKRAWRESVRAASLDTTDKILVPVLTQAMFAAIIWVGWEAAEQPPALLTRAITAALPFLLLPVLFALKWLALPPTLAREADQSRPDPEAARRRNEIAAFTAPADRENKIKALDEIRTFAAQVHGLHQEAAKLSPNKPSATADVDRLKESIASAYRHLHALADRSRQYPALVTTISATPSKEPLYKDMGLLKAALEARTAPLIQHHHGNVRQWVQQFDDWWRSVDLEMLDLRSRLSGG